MIRVGIIGTGGMGNHHARILSQMKKVKVITVCDVSKEKATKLAEEIGAKSCVDYHQLLDEVDAVWICTPPFKRTEIATTCSKAGKDVFLEKPIALGLTDADNIVNTAAEAGIKLQLGYVLRFTNPYKLLHDTFSSGELGELVNCWTRRYMPFNAKGRWYGKQNESGGVLLDVGRHDVDWLRWIGGEVQTVFGKVFRVRKGIEADEHAQAVIIFKNSGMGTIEVSWSSTLSEESVGIVGTKGSMIVDSTGKIRKKIEGKYKGIISNYGKVSADSSGNPGIKVNSNDQIENVAMDNETIQGHFIRCIEENLEPIVTGRDGRVVLEVILAIRKSAKIGKSVNL